MATISPSPKLQFLDANGDPLSYGLLYTYSAGTTSAAVTYTTAAQTTANTNPIVLDSRGQADVWLTAGTAYKFVLQDSFGVLQYTVDQLTAAGTMSTQNANAVAITGGTISGVTITGPITGTVTGNVTGDVTGNLTGNVTGGTVAAASYNGGQLAGLRNKIMNGAMLIAQKGTSLTATTGTNTRNNSLRMLDRWTYIGNTTQQSTMTQQSDGPASDSSLPYSMRLTVTTADPTVGASEYFTVAQILEGYDARTLVGKTFTISFWVRSSVVGTYGLVLYNGAWPSTDYSYVVEYAISTANTWEYKTIQITNGLITTGSNWNWTSGAGVTVGWTLYGGVNIQTSATNTWNNNWYLTTPSQVNAVGTIGNIFALTGVQIEVGNQATPFEHRPMPVELAMCERYYEKSFPFGTAPAQNTGATLGAAYAVGQVLNQAFSTAVTFAVTKRAAPTITTFAPDAATANWSTNATTPTVATANIGDSGFALAGTTAVTAGNSYSIHWTASADI